MKNTLTFLLLFAGFGLAAQPAVCDNAYLRSMAVYVYSNATKQQYMIAAHGDNPAISPDGTQVAYTATRQNGDMYIVLYNLASKKKVTLDTHNGNCYGAAWSPDGKMLAYNAFLGSKWAIGIMNADNTGARLLGTEAEDVYQPVWVPDGKSIIAHDMNNIKLIDLAGNVIQRISLPKLEGGLPELKEVVGTSSNDRFIITNDNRKIIFSSSINEDAPEGPPDAVFVYDIASAKTLRLTPKGYDAGGVALGGNKALFTISKLNGKTVNVGTEDLDGKNLKVLFTGCLSVSAKQ